MGKSMGWASGRNGGMGRMGGMGSAGHLLAVLLTTLLLLAGCGGGGGGGGSDNPAPPPPAAPPTAPTPAPPVTITVQPADRSAVAGSAVSFTVVARDALSYQWQQTDSASDAAPWRDIAGAAEASYTTPATTVPMSGLRFRVVVGGAAGQQIISSAASLTVSAVLEPPSILAHPQARSVYVGQTADFSVTASGSALNYLWQTSVDGGTVWTDLPERSLPGITWTATADAGARRFRVIVSNSLASTASEPAVLTVLPAPGAPSVVTQPQALVEAVAGTSALFTVEVAGSPSPATQWERSRDGGTRFETIPGATARGLVLPALTTADDGLRVRVVASNASGSVTSSVGVLRVASAVAPAVTVMPSEQTVGAGQPVTIRVASLTGVPTPTLQWQIARAGSDVFSTYSGNTTSTLMLPFITAADSGVRFRLVATNTAGVATSEPAVVRFGAAPTAIVSPGIPALQPGATWNFSANVTGIPTPTLQWQRAAAASDVFVDIDGATGLTYATPPLAAADNGSRYRLLARNALGSVASAAVPLQVASFPSVRLDPASLEVVIGDTAPLTAVVNDTLPLEGVTWSVRDASGGAYTVIEGATSLSYTPPAASSATRRIYKVEVRNALGGDSEEVLVIWRQPVAPVLQPGPLRVGAALRGETITLDARAWFSFEAPALSWAWEQSLDEGTTWSVIDGAAGPVLTLPNVSLAHDGRLVRVQVSNSVGTSSASARLAVAPVAVAPSAANLSNREGLSHVRDQLLLQSGSSVALDRPFHEAPIGVRPAVGVPMPSLRRQWSRDGGVTWRDFQPGDRFQAPTTVQASDEGLLLREVASNAAGSATSQAVRLRVTDSSTRFWLSWPRDIEVPEGGVASFEAVTPTLIGSTYWQQSRDGGASWTRITAAIELGRDRLATLPVAAADTGLLVRHAVENGGLTHFSGPGKLTVRAAASATLWPWVGNAGGRGFRDGSAEVSRLLEPSQLLPARAGGVHVVDGARVGDSAAQLRRLEPSGRLRTDYFPAIPTGPIVAVAEAPDGTLFLATASQIWRRPPSGVLGLLASLSGVSGLAALADGSLVVTDAHCVRRLGTDGVLRLLAGACGSAGGSVDGVGSAARFDSPRAPVPDGAGNLFAVEPSTGLLRRIDGEGRVSSRRVTVESCAAGLCTELPLVVRDLARAADGRWLVATDLGVVRMSWGDAAAGELLAGSPAPAAAVAVGSAGLLVATGTVRAGMFVVGASTGRRIDGGAAVWQQSGSGWQRIAGRESEAGTDDGLGAAARFVLPRALRLDAMGGLVVVDQHAFTIRRVEASGLVTTLAGQAGVAGSANGMGTTAQFTQPGTLALQADGTAFVSDSVVAGPLVNFVLRRISAAGAVSTMALTLDPSAPPVGAVLPFTGLVALPDGGLLARGNAGVHRVSADGVISKLFWETALTGTAAWGCRDNPGPLALAASGELYIGCGHWLLRVSPGGSVEAIGSRNSRAQGDGASGSAGFGHVSDLAFDGQGRLLIADSAGQTIRRLELDGSVRTVLGIDARGRVVSRSFVVGSAAPIEYGGIVMGEQPRLNAVLGVAWLGGDRFAIASEQGIHIALIP